MPGSFSTGQPLHTGPQGATVRDEAAGVDWIQDKDPEGETWVNSLDARIQYAEPTSGSTVPVDPINAVSALILDPPETLSTLTITLPEDDNTPRNGQILRVTSRKAITTLTVDGAAVHGAPSSMAADGFFVLVYCVNTSAWHRCG